MDTNHEKAYNFAKKNKRLIIEKFIVPNLAVNQNPRFIFMAGAPGAGKTETSKWLIDTLKKQKVVEGIARIDADEVRDIFRDFGYDGTNSDNYKRACTKGVDMLFDHCIKNRFHTLIDGTFSSTSKIEENIKSALNVNAVIFIIYVYQDPIIAWGYTKIREKEEGRRVAKEMFVKSFFQSIKNVKDIKNKYGDNIEVWFVEKEISNKTRKVEFNVKNIEDYFKISYNEIELLSILYEKEK